MSIKMKLEGFEDLLKDIEAAGGSMVKATESCMKQSAYTMQNALKSEMLKANVPADLVNGMPQFDVKTEGNHVEARVGYKKGNYDPENLSDGYKVVFLNYGTPRRSKHGKIKDVAEGGTIHLGFIQRAKSTAKKQIKKQQRETLDKIFERLKK